LTNKNKNRNKEVFIRRLIRRIYNSRIFNPIRKYLEKLRIRIEKSIRFELMVVVAICFLVSSMFYGFSNRLMRKETSKASITYNYSAVESRAKDYVERINSKGKNITLKDEQFFTDLFYNINGGEKAYLTDLDGKVIKKSSNVAEDKIDIFAVMSNIANFQAEKDQGQELKYVYPVTIGADKGYFIYSDNPGAEIKYSTYVVTNSFFAQILTCIVFIVLFIVITNKKMKYLDEIALGLKKIASGDLNYHIEESGNDEIRNIATNINYMSKEINRKIVAQRRAEKTKTDLITNVSHDLRTPLTSIMGYIGLVKDGRYENDETMKEYLNIAFNKSEKLKVLIEDLFEYTKLNNEGIKLTKSEVNISEFIFQLTEELTPLFEENGLSIIKSAAEDKLIVNVDADKMLRVFENLFTNAIKYSYKPGKIVVGIYGNSDFVTIAIRNKGDNISPEKISKLFERFYRVDESRNAQSGGSGLGLAISKNIVELHDGQIWAECYGEDISFYVKLKCTKIPR